MRAAPLAVAALLDGDQLALTEAVLAAGPGGEEIYLLSPDSGAKPGQRVK
jgi:hypothetical protein